MGCRILLLALLWGIPFFTYSQFNDNFSKGNLDSWTQSPSNRWNTILDKIDLVLHHCYDNSTAGRDFITSKYTIPSYENGRLTWRFRVKHGYAPSLNNGWAVILSSDADAAQLSSSSSSRCLVVGVNFSGSDDLLKVWEQSTSSAGSKSVKMIASSTLNWETGIGTDSFGYIKVVRNANGEWSIGYSKSSYIDVKQVASFSYTNPLPTGHLGVVYWYTASADKNLWVGDFLLNYDETNPTDKDSYLKVLALEDTVVTSTSKPRTVLASSFSIKDKGTKDGKPTIVSALKGYVSSFPKSAFNLASWQKAFRLISDGNEVASTTSFADTMLTVALAKPDTITNGTIKNYRLLVNLPDSLPDGFSVAFNFDVTNPVHTAANSSKIGSIQLEKARIIKADAIAERFRMEPNLRALLKGEKIAPSFYAIDCFGNVDADFEKTCDLTIRGKDAFSVSKNGVKGIVSFDSIAVAGDRLLDLRLVSEGMTTLEKRIVLLNDTTSTVYGVANDYHEATVKNINPSNTIDVASFNLRDSGGDRLPTTVKALDFSVVSSKIDVEKVFAGATLTVNGKSKSCRIARLTKDALLVEVFGDALKIEDGERVAVTLGLYFNAEEFVDLGNLSFKLLGVTADSTGSLFSTIGSIPVNTIRFLVQADTLSFSKIPSAVKPNTFFDVSLKACDKYGNIDVDFEGDCRIFITGPSSATYNQRFSSGSAKVAGIKLAKSGEYTLTGASVNLKTFKKIVVADDDSYLKVSTLPVKAVAATSTSNYYDALRFLIVDTGIGDTLSTRITQLTLQSVDSLNALLLMRRVDSAKVFLNGKKIDVAGVSFTGGKVVLKFADSALVIPNCTEGEIAIKIKLSKQPQMFPFYLSVPAEGVMVCSGSSLVSKACSYPIRSSVISYDVIAEHISIAPHPIIITAETPIDLKCLLTNAEGDLVTSFTGKVSAEIDGFSTSQPILSGGIISINALKPSRLGDASVRLMVNDTISMKATFRVVTHMDSLLLTGVEAAAKEGWEHQTSGSYLHSGSVGRSLLCYAISPSATARSTQWHLRFKLDNANFSSENYMRIILLSDRVPYEDSSYAAVALSYKKYGGKSFFQIESLVNGRVVKRSDSIYTKGIEGKMAEAFLIRDYDGLWSGDIYISGCSCCHFENLSMPYSKVAAYSGIEYQCSTSNVGKLRMESFDMVGSEQHLQIVDGYYSSKGHAELTVNMPITSPKEIILAAKDSQGHANPVSDITANGCKIHFRLGDAAASSYNIKVEQRVNGQTYSDSASIRIRSGLEYGDVTISEIMSDPTPTAGLPEVEYLELYNRIADTLQVDGWTIQVNGKTWRCSKAKINPFRYLVISSASGAAALSMYGNASGAISFDGLPNEKADIAILNSQEKVIATSFYSGDYLTREGIQGGISLEKVDLASNVEGGENWAPSKDKKGGTPGATNSVIGRVTDTSPPSVYRLTVEGRDMVSITFNEPVIIGDNFAVELGGNFVSSTLEYDPVAPRTISINLSKSLEPNILQLLTLRDVTDYSGNVFTSELQVALCNRPVKGDLLINEVLFNPDGECSDYVELVNVSSKPIDLSSVILCRRNTEGKLEEVKRLSESLYILSPKEYVLLCSTPDPIAVRYPRSDTKRFHRLDSMPSYPNDGGVVVVADTLLNIVDELAYSEKMQFKILPTFDGVSLERISLSESNWQSASKESGYGTPGAENSQLLRIDAANSPLKLSSSVISPDGDGVNDYLAVAYRMESAGMMADVDIFNGDGVEVKKLCRNELLGTEGTFVWDGVTDGGMRASRGIYILIARLADAEGHCKEIRQVFSLAYR